MEKTKLLVIDDNKDLVEVISKYFDSIPNIDVSLVAHDGKEAINIIDKKQNDFNIIILDLVMPNKDGVYFLEELERLDIEKDVIVMTSFNSDTVIRKIYLKI